MLEKSNAMILNLDESFPNPTQCLQIYCVNFVAREIATQ
jgi:hypothetical protein